MAASNVLDLLLRFKGDASDLRSTMSQVRSELGAQTKATQTANRSELSMRQQLAAVSSLQRQRSAALIGEWKRTERAAANLASGVRPVSQNLQRVTDIMQALGSSSAALQGPMGGVASRLRSLGAVATEAGGGLGIAATAVGAMIVATGALAIAIYKLTVQTAEFQGKMFDLSQATGVSVETLSAFEVLATTTGGSIDSITASLGIFQRNLEDAQVSTSKEAKLLKELGVETNNTEQALRQTLKALAAMPAGFTQTSRALELFGRGGKQMLAILKEMDGDLDGAISKFRAMGILIDTQTAKAADQFNDQLAILSFQLRGIVALVGREAMPIILNAVQSVSKALSDNRQVISEWARSIGDAGRGALILGSYLAKLGGIITGLGNIPIPMILRILGSVSGATGILSGLAQLGASSRPAVNPRQARLDRFNQLADDALAANVGHIPKGGGGKGKKERDTSFQDALKDADLAERAVLQKLAVQVRANKNALESQTKDIEEYTQRAINLADDRLDAAIDRINAEQQAIDTALARRLIKQDEYDHRNRALAIETAEAVEKKEAEVFGLEDERDKKLAANDLAAHERSVRLADEAAERLIRIIQDRIDRQEIAESDGEKQIAVILATGFERRKRLLEDELDNYGTTLERRREINDELILLDGERANSAERAARRIKDAQESEAPQRPRRIRDQERPRRVGDEPIPEDISIWDAALQAWQERIGDFHDAGKAFHDAAQLYVVGAFHNMADAATDAVQAWILYGGSLGKALKQALAAELAHVAASAAIRAALHAAYAIGSLAFGNFAAAGQHALAAAKFAAVAALTGIAARGLASSAAASQSGGVTAGSAFQSATRAGSGSTAGQPTTIDVNRRTSSQAINITVRLQGDIATDALKTRVIDAVVEGLNRDNDPRLTTGIQGAAKRG